MSNTRKTRTAKRTARKKWRLLTLFMVILITVVSITYIVDGRQSAEQNQESEQDIDINNSSAGAGSDKNNAAGDKIDDDNITFLLVGEDDKKEGGSARTDTIMIANYEPDNGSVQLASIMRDSYVEIPGHQNNKINSSYSLGGIDLLKETIEQNFDITIDHHATVNFDGFVEVVDTVAPDGIEVDIEERMYYQDNSGEVSIDLAPGTQKLDGKDALKYVRFRSDQNNDFGRVARQQEMLEAVQEEILSFATLSKVPQLIGTIRPNLETDLNTGKMLGLGRDVLLNNVETVETLRVPEDGTYSNESYSHSGAVLEIDMMKNREVLHSFLYDETYIDNQSASEEKGEEEGY
ncbi:LCP family protein [Alteribacillus sp. HJP-4]|uniref:LCP family protein n=1 Tax=Alteribacillus sp. HJP-4 TaxID=2775394 RepID=UPI0035CCF6E1